MEENEEKNEWALKQTEKKVERYRQRIIFLKAGTTLVGTATAATVDCALALALARSEGKRRLN